MPLLNRGAIANFFGLADEEEYEYQDYPETTKKAVQPTKKNTTQNQSTHSVSAANTHEKQKTATSRPVTHESIQPAEKKKVIEQDHAILSAYQTLYGFAHQKLL